MTAHITVAQARAAGIDVPAAKKKRTTRRTVKGAPYFTTCKACGMEFRTEASEDRHLDENPTHCRYELVLGT